MLRNSEKVTVTSTLSPKCGNSRDDVKPRPREKKKKGEKKGEHEKEGRERNNHITIIMTPQTPAHMSEQALRLRK
jgi:hypothetical protein